MTSPFKQKCLACTLSTINCICPETPAIQANGHFVLLFHAKEPGRQTNTGRLILSAFRESSAFIWDRILPPKDLLLLINQEDVQPWLVFPHSEETAQPSEFSYSEAGRKPLFIIIDATWQQAAKIVRKSPWLTCLPRLDLKFAEQSRYELRKNQKASRVCTAETATQILRLVNQDQEADRFDLYFQRFMRNFIADKQQKKAPALSTDTIS